MSPIAQTETPPQRRPLRADAERNRQRILVAARVVFAERGLAVTLDDIAKQAGVGVGTVYRRFETREALIDELFEERLLDFGAQIESAAERPDAWPALVEVLEYKLSLHAADRGFDMVMSGNKFGSEGCRNARDRMVAPLRSLVERAQADGDLRADASFLDIPLTMMMVGKIIESTRDTAPDLWRRFLAIAIDGLRADSGVRTPLPSAGLTIDELDAIMQSGCSAP